MKYDVSYNPTLCTGCLRCMLACSRTYMKQFQPPRSWIQIQFRRGEYRCDFSADCIECGICADACLFGALDKQSREEAA